LRKASILIATLVKVAPTAADLFPRILRRSVRTASLAIIFGCPALDVCLRTRMCGALAQEWGGGDDHRERGTNSIVTDIGR